MISILTALFALSTFFSIMYFNALRRREPVVATIKSSELERELTDASAQMVRSVKKLETVSAQLLKQQKERERQLLETQQHYESLRALAAGQKEIAEAHRAILEQRSFRQRVVDFLTAFFIGVLSSLVATFLWYLRHSKPVSTEEIEKLGLK